MGVLKTTFKGSDWSVIIQVQTNEKCPSDTYEVLLDDNRMTYYMVIDLSHNCLKLTGKYVLSVQIISKNIIHAKLYKTYLHQLGQSKVPLPTCKLAYCR